MEHLTAALVDRRETNPGDFMSIPQVPPHLVDRRVHRKAYWCHICCSSRVKNANLSDHYRKAHPGIVRDASSKTCTTWADSRHGLSQPSRLSSRSLIGAGPYEALSDVSHFASSRPQSRFQARPQALAHLPELRPDVIPTLRQPSVPPQTASGYHTIRNTTGLSKIVTLKVRSPPESPESPPQKRRRTSPQLEAELDYWGEIIDEDNDSVEDTNAYDISSDESWGRITGVRRVQRNELSREATADLDAGSAHEGEAQESVTSPVDAPAASEVSGGEEGLSRLESAVRLLFQKNAEQRDMLVEVMELIMAKSS